MCVSSALFVWRRVVCTIIAYLDRACVVRVEVDYGLSPTREFNLVLRTEPRHDYIVPQSVYQTVMSVPVRGAPLIVLEPLGPSVSMS
jgi:hypothetical protein